MSNDEVETRYCQYVGFFTVGGLAPNNAYGFDGPQLMVYGVQVGAEERVGPPASEVASITRSISLRVAYDDPDATRRAIAKAVEAGFSRIILRLSAPYPLHVARWAVDESIHR